MIFKVGVGVRTTCPHSGYAHGSPGLLEAYHLCNADTLLVEVEVHISFCFNSFLDSAVQDQLSIETLLLLLLTRCSLLLPMLVCFLFRCEVLVVRSGFAIILIGNRELVAFLISFLMSCNY